MRNLYSLFAVPTLAKQLKQTVGQASMCFVKMLLATMFMITVVSVKLFAQAPVIGYNSPQIYTVNSAITPLSPTGSGVAAPAYSSTLVSLGAGFSSPGSVATDAAGNVYVADEGHNQVKKIPVGGGSTLIIGTGFLKPSGVAVDAAGNVYVADSGNGVVKKIPAGGGAIVTLNPGSGASPVAVAVDVAGNVYEADAANADVVEIPVSGAAAFSLGSFTPAPTGVAVDAAGNVYVAGGPGGLNEIPAGGGAPVILGSEFTTPYGVAADAAGNVYVADAGSNTIWQLAAGGSTPVAINSGFNNPTGVAIDRKGNIYVADKGNNAVKKIAPVGGYYIGPFLPAGLSFNNTTGVISGTPTAVSATANYTITAYNNNGSSSATVSITISANNTNLTNLVLSTGTLSPAFASGTKSYTASLSSPVTSVMVTPTTGDGAATITVNGAIVASGSASASLPLALGPNTITITVTDGTIIDTYTVILTRIPSSNAGLAGLAISTGTISPAFATGTRDYIAQVSNTTASITVTPTASDATATITVNGVAVASGSASQSLPLTTGLNTITTVVTAQDGITTDTYTLTVTQPPAGLSISYSGPQAYPAGTAISLAPTSSGVAAPGYSSSPITLGSGFSAPRGVAADAAGNVYVADYGNNAVKEIPAGGGAPVTLGSGFNGPSGVAVDAAGNVYVADYGNNAVKKIPVGGGPVISLDGFNNPAGIALDASGNVFASDYRNGGFDGAVINGSGTGGEASGVAVDGAGNVYVAAQSSNKVTEFVAANGYRAGQLGAVLSAPSGIAVDGAGNIFVADLNNPAIIEVPAGGGAQVTIGSGLKNPWGAAVDAAGNVYVADAGNNAVKEITPVGGYHISPSLPAGLGFDQNTGIISGTPIVGSPATNYTITAYNSSGSTFATVSIEVDLPPLPAISYSSPQTYTVGTAIAPLLPTGGNGVAPPAYSSTAVLINTGLFEPDCVAVDATGNMYVADAATATVVEFPVGSSTPVTIASGFGNPKSMAVDAADNLYIANGGAVYKIPAGGGAGVSIRFGFNSPAGVAIDAQGNLYVADAGSNSVVEFPVGGPPVVLYAGFNQPASVAVGATGNVYVADAGNNEVKMILAGGGLPVIIGSGFNNPTGVAVDAEGNVYITDTGNNAVKEIPVGGGPPVSIGPNFSSPQGLTVAGPGNVYVCELGTRLVKEIKPVGGYYISALPAGLRIDPATGIISGAPTVVSPATNYTITGYNIAGGGAAAANIQIVSNPVTLANLVLSSGTLTPSFASGTNSYTALVDINTTSITITPTTTDPTATVTVNGTTVASGSASAGIPLTPGTNTITIVVTAQDGVSTNTYTVTIINTPTAIASLSDLTISPGTLSPSFSTATTSYTVNVTNGTGSINLTPTAADATEIIKVNGGIVASGSTTSSYLAIGLNTFTIFVSSMDGTGTKIYTVTVDRASNDALLSSIHLTPLITLTNVPGPGFLNYAALVPLATSSVTVTATEQDPTATTTVNGMPVASGVASPSIPLTPGQNIVNTVCTAQDGVTTKTYIITLSYGSIDALLTSIALTPATPLTVVAGPSYVNYTATVPGTTSSITVTPTLQDATATMTVNGIAVASGTASQSIPLAYGVNVINIVVTAQNGATTKTYTINLGRGSSDALLTSIGLTPNSGLTVVSGPSYVNYTTSVPNATSSVMVTAVVQDPTATISVNGTPVASGSASPPIPLAVGSNVINVVSTAQDGITTKTYTITATRAPSADALLTSIKLTPAEILTVVTGPSFLNYTTLVDVGTTSVQVTSKVQDAGATIKVNGTAVASGEASAPIALAIGPNVINIVVTAQDGIATKTYTITISRGATDATLSSFTISNGTLSPAFSASTTSYTDAIANITAGITVLLTTDDPNATVTANGTTITSGVRSPEIPINVGSNTLSIIVTAQNGVTSQAYTIIITRPPSTNALLASITTSPVETLVGTTGPGYLNFNAAAANSVTSIQVIPTAKDPTATITVNGTPVASGSPSQAIALNLGTNTITTVLTAQDGVTTKTVIITVTRLPSADATLSNFTISNGTLSPVFSPGTTSYSDVISNFTSSITVLPTTNNPGATITVNGISLASGVRSSEIPMNVGSNTVTVIVTAQNGTTTKTYTIAVNRTLSSNALLSSIALSPATTLTGATGPGYLNFTAAVINSTSSVQVIPTAQDATATITVNGAAVASGSASASIPLLTGPNTITTVITAQDGVTTKTVIITITRAQSANASLSALKISSGTLAPAFATATTTYTASVTNATTSITITPTTSDATATVKVNGTIVSSGSASIPIALSLGANVINTIVTAQNGTSTQTYKITVTRVASTDALLTSIKFTPAATLTIASGPSYVNYTTSVPYTTTSVTVTSTVQDATATIAVNGTTVASGVASPSIPLNVGSNVINIVVTAQNGVTTKTYTITATRELPSDALLTSIKLAPAANLTIVSGPSYVNYTASYANSVSSCTVTATEQDAMATLTVNGTDVVSGNASGPIALSVGSGNVINIVSTAQDGTTIKTYTITVTRNGPSGENSLDQSISVTKPTDNIPIENDGIVVHQGVSPNGDGINDYLTIDGITNYPDNRLMIVDRNGIMIYQTKGYDNSSKLFDGHSSTDGKMQLPGTYFYTLDYTAANGENKHKTGYIILKY